MKIALLSPSYWPEVRRGTERVVHDTALQLESMGHEPTVITTHPGRSTSSWEEGFTVMRLKRPPRIPQLRWYEDHVDSAVPITKKLLQGDYDVAHAFHPSCAFLELKAQAFGAPPLVFSLHGIPLRRFLVQRRYRLEMLRATVEGAAASTVLSKAAADPFRRYLLRDPIVMPAGIFPEMFTGPQDRAPEPTLVCAASLDDERKRGDVLLDGFTRLRSKRPDARLILLPPKGARPPALPQGVVWKEVDTSEGLAQAYRSAWVNVLASVEEAQGLVLIESLASGTPVVGARSGAVPEVVDSNGVGRLFEPDDPEDLARAMSEALDLLTDPATAEACRVSARRYDWASLIEDCVDLYERAVQFQERR